MPEPAVAAKPLTMRVKIWAPFKVYFDAEAQSLSAANDTGPFDILPRHHNFMCLIKPGPVTVRRSGQPDFTMNIERGIMHVKADRTTIFLDI